MAANSTLTNQVVLYSNHLLMKKTNNGTLHRVVQNLQGKITNLKNEIPIPKGSSHIQGVINNFKVKKEENFWANKIDVKPYSTWWIYP